MKRLVKRLSDGTVITPLSEVEVKIRKPDGKVIIAALENPQEMKKLFGAESNS